MRYAVVDFDFGTKKKGYSRTYDYLIPDYITPEDVASAKIGIVENPYYKAGMNELDRYKQVHIRKVYETGQSAKATKFLVDVFREDKYKEAVKKQEKDLKNQKDAQKWVESLSPEDLVELFLKEKPYKVEYRGVWVDSGQNFGHMTFY